MPILILFYRISRMRESGLLSHWKKKYWPGPNACTSSRRVSAPAPLTIENLTGHFLLWVIGIGLASIAFLSNMVIRFYNLRV